MSRSRVVGLASILLVTAIVVLLPTLAETAASGSRPTAHTTTKPIATKSAQTTQRRPTTPPIGTQLEELRGSNTVSGDSLVAGSLSGWLAVRAASSHSVNPATGSSTSTTTRGTGGSRLPAGGRLSKVSCRSAAFCLAIGSYGEADSGSRPLVLLVDHTDISVMSVPSPRHWFGAALDGISCPSPGFCVAVGDLFQRGDSASRPFAETLRAGSWTIDSLPNTGDTSSLASISCVSQSFCVAVGTRDQGNTTMIETLDNDRWTVASGVDFAGPKPSLTAVACTSSSFCLAAGWYTNNAGNIAESWNGRIWTRSIPPGAGSTLAYIDDVSCFAPRSCVAVGDFPNAERYIDGFWSALPSKTADYLSGVSCSGPSFCMTTGAHGVQPQAVAGQFRNGTWHLAQIPSDGELIGGTSVSCSSLTQCLVIGDGHAGAIPLVDIFNGTMWSVLSG